MSRESPLPDSRPTLGLSPPSSIPIPTSAPPKARSRATDDSWTYLRGFTRVLDQCAGIFGPLKTAMDELLECIEIHEVSTS